MIVDYPEELRVETELKFAAMKRKESQIEDRRLVERPKTDSEKTKVGNDASAK